jgi:imidazolonepropionase-like amidohydrolase
VSRLPLLVASLALVSGACRASATAFVGANVLAPDFQRFRPDQTVLVSGEVIERVGPAGSFALPPGTRTIDARGKWLIPGLADAHGHPPDAEDDALSFEQYLLMQLAAGVTSVRSMRGTEVQLEWRERIARGEVDGPRLFVAGMLEDTRVGEARERVQALAARGYDHLKILGGVDREAYLALAEEARAVGLPFCGHVPDGIALDDVLAVGQGVEHLMGFTAALQAGSSPAELAHRAAEAHVFQCPTQYFRQTYWRADDAAEMRARAGVEWMPRADRERWERWLAEEPPDPAERERALAEVPARFAFLRALAEAGAPLLVSGSHGWWIPPGFGVIDEMELFAAAGLPSSAILRAASSELAAFYGREDEWGRIAPGQRADLVLLSADPLADVANVRRIEGTMARGRWLDEAELLRRIAKLRDATDGVPVQPGTRSPGP